MAYAGQVIHSPVMRCRIEFRKTAADTDGALLEFDCFLAPGGTIARPHYHPRQHEHFTVLAGQVRGRLGDMDRTVARGETVDAPPGVPHAWSADAAIETRLRVEFRPALDTEGFLETAFGLARDGLTSSNGIPRPLQLAVLLAAHPGEFHPAAMPALLFRLFVALCAPIGRLLGRRAHYPRYTNVATALPAPALPTTRDQHANPRDGVRENQT